MAGGETRIRGLTRSSLNTNGPFTVYTATHHRSLVVSRLVRTALIHSFFLQVTCGAWSVLASPYNSWVTDCSAVKGLFHSRINYGNNAERIGNASFAVAIIIVKTLMTRVHRMNNIW